MKKLSKILLVLITFMITLMFDRVLAETLGAEGYTGEGSTGSSDKCNMDYCGRMDPDYYGLRITFMKKDSSGKLVASNPLNFPSNGDTNKYGTYYLVNSSFLNFYQGDPDVIEVQNFQSINGLNRGLSSSAESFANYLSNDSLSAGNNALVKNMLKLIYANYETNSNLSGYYMEIEPFVRFKIIDNVNSDKYIFNGTPSGIVNKLMNKSDDFYKYNKTRGGNPLTTIAQPFAVVTANGRDSSYRCSYYNSSKTKLLGVSGKSSTYSCQNIYGNWNVLRDYYTSMYINTNTIAPYTNSLGLSYDSDKRLQTSSTALNNHSAYAFSQINGSSVFGKTLIELSKFGIASCESDFDASDKSIQSRYNIFVKYGKQFNNLFNFDSRVTGKEACQSNKSCKPSKCRLNEEDYVTCNSESSSCLNYNYESSAEDYSCYSELKLKDEKTINYICNTDFKFENKLGSTSFNVWPGLRLTGTDGVVGTVRIFKRCYVNSGTPRLLLKYSDNELNKYVSSIKFNGESLKAKLSTISRKSNKGETPTIVYDAKNNKIDDNYISYNGTNELNNVMIKTDYGHEYVFFDYNVYASNHYLEKGNGAKEETILENHSYETARGIFTSYNWRKKSSGEIPFEIKFTKEGEKAYFTYYNSAEDKNETNKCTYNVSNNGLFSNYSESNNNDDLNLEFRIIDTKNPFTKFGSNDSRNTMTNWCDKTAKDNQCLPTNNVVKKYITDKPNSYGLVNGVKVANNKIKYKITLTPQLMDDIKETAKSKNITYDRFNLTCKNKKCTSELLTYLNNNSTLTINGSTKR